MNGSLFGDVVPAGVFAMIDDGELDWKVIAINAADPKAASVNDVEDVERCVLLAIILLEKL
jgi:inorganic pyrophosphatase